jgi:hypothetical protein
MTHQEDNQPSGKDDDDHARRKDEALAQIQARLAALERDKADRADLDHLAQQLKSLSQP